MRKIKLNPIILLIALALPLLALPARAFPYTSEAIDISGRKYVPVVKDALSKAQKSIYLVMYFVSFDPRSKQSPVNGLVEELVNAHKRGVKVKVILDQNISFDDWERDPRNDAFFAYLKQQGIEAYYDNIFVVTHNKAIVIDEETVIVGSANWTESSLRKNKESSCLIRSKELAKEFLDEFSGIAIDHEASILPAERNPPTRVSDNFLSDPSLASRMVATRDKAAFDLYLLLLRNFDHNPEGRVDIDYKSIISTLGLDGKYSYETASDIVREALIRLDERYKLIRRVTQFPRPPYCILLNYPGAEPYVFPEQKYCSLPDEYWSYGWNKRLTYAEKYFLLINLRKSGASPGHIWAGHRAGIMDEFNVTKITLIRGIMGLRKLNIIEVEYPDYPEGGGYEHRAAMRFKFLGLYSPEIVQIEKQNLQKRYGKKRFNQAEKYARIVFKENDLQVLEDIIEKIDEYGSAEVKKAFAKISSRNPDNPKRTYKYAIGILNRDVHPRSNPLRH